MTNEQYTLSYKEDGIRLVNKIRAWCDVIEYMFEKELLNEQNIAPLRPFHLLGNRALHEIELFYEYDGHVLFDQFDVDDGHLIKKSVFSKERPGEFEELFNALVVHYTMRRAIEPNLFEPKNPPPSTEQFPDIQKKKENL